MSGVLLGLWIVGLIISAYGVVAAGYNSDDGWSVVWLAAVTTLILTGVKVGWIG